MITRKTVMKLRWIFLTFSLLTSTFLIEASTSTFTVTSNPLVVEKKCQDYYVMPRSVVLKENLDIFFDSEIEVRLDHGARDAKKRPVIKKLFADIEQHDLYTAWLLGDFDTRDNSPVKVGIDNHDLTFTLEVYERDLFMDKVLGLQLKSVKNLKYYPTENESRFPLYTEVKFENESLIVYVDVYKDCLPEEN